MTDHFAPLWNRIAGHLKNEVSPDTFERWFAAIRLVGADEEKLVLQVPNDIYQVWIETNYLPLVQGAVLSVLESPRAIAFQTNGHQPAPKPAAVAAKVSTALAAEAEVTTAPANGMNPRNTFDTFVVGRNSDFAHAAALAVAQAPSRTYNPLFLHGGVGLGKTHLMHAIGQFIGGKKKGAKVMYVSCEKFGNDFIEAIQTSSLTKFRKRYRQADVLLIDDIQFLCGKDRSQEEFFHTFNTLFDGHKQIVLSSDKPPTELEKLEARLISRFEWGLTAELQPPDIETRVAILRKKATTLSLKVDPHVIDFLAQRIRTNVRRLEGALMRVASFSTLSGKQLTDDAMENLLRDLLAEEARTIITIDQIQKKVADHFDIRLADMTSKRRPNNIAKPRQIAMYLARVHTKASLHDIGDAFGGRDHGTVLHAHRVVRDQMAKDEKTRQTISFLESALTRNAPRPASA